MLDPGTEDHRRDGWQARALEATRHPHSAAALGFLRRRLDRWQVHVLPGHRCRGLTASMKSIAALMPPRVLAAALGANLNGWMTARRFQHGGGCVLGCEGREDSVEHYSFCSRYHGCCRRFLRLEPPEAVHRLEDFLLLKPASRWQHGGHHETGVRAAAMRALSVYALYRTHNALRKAAPCPGTSTRSSSGATSVRGSAATPRRWLC